MKLFDDMRRTLEYLSEMEKTGTEKGFGDWVKFALTGFVRIPETVQGHVKTQRALARFSDEVLTVRERLEGLKEDAGSCVDELTDLVDEKSGDDVDSPEVEILGLMVPTYRVQVDSMAEAISITLDITMAEITLLHWLHLAWLEGDVSEMKRLQKRSAWQRVKDTFKKHWHKILEYIPVIGTPISIGKDIHDVGKDILEGDLEDAAKAKELLKRLAEAQNDLTEYLDESDLTLQELQATIVSRWKEFNDSMSDVEESIRGFLQRCKENQKILL